jgi:hypothetical protein
MNLYEVDSEEKMLQALQKRDPDLEQDLTRAISAKLDRAWSHGLSDVEMMGAEELVMKVSDEHLEEITAGNREVQEFLEPLDKDAWKKSLRDEVELAAEALEAWTQGKSRTPARFGSKILAFETGRGGGITLGPTYTSVRVSLDEEPLSWVPAEKVREILKKQGPTDAEWEDLGDGDYDSGWIDSGDYWRLKVDSDQLYEWASDLRREFFSEMVDADPEVAIKTFLDLLKKSYPELAKKVKKAKFPKDVLADYAVTYFEDPESGVEIITEAVGSFGYEGTRGEVILEIDQAALSALGITDGRWASGAPWRLVNLPVEELAYEGTLQRHCVGRHNMGYRSAVARGVTQIWSLRSRFNLPILTFEINVHDWQSQQPIIRAGAIEQLKGKLNRLAGEDPDEAAVLHWIFAKLGVDPAGVEDFVGVQRNPLRGKRTVGFDRPWQPYRGARRSWANPSGTLAELKRKLMR